MIKRKTSNDVDDYSGIMKKILIGYNNPEFYPYFKFNKNKKDKNY